MDKILSIDPSGTGTSGIYFKNGEQEQFQQFQSKEWKEHYLTIKQLVQEYQPNILLYENTNFISLRGKDMTSLLRLLGSLEVIEVEKVKSIPVDQVKRLTKKLLAGEVKIAELEYKVGRGKGWMFKGKRVSIHQLEAYLVYYLSK